MEEGGSELGENMLLAVVGVVEEGKLIDAVDKQQEGLEER